MRSLPRVSPACARSRWVSGAAPPPPMPRWRRRSPICNAAWQSPAPMANAGESSPRLRRDSDTVRTLLRGWRRRVGAFIGGFEAGLANRRLKGFQPSRVHLNTLIAAAGPDITARARWLVRNNGYAANAIESWAGNVVGAGIKPSSSNADAAVKA